jgi:transcriptional regulator with XRE-family HTH domain
MDDQQLIREAIRGELDRVGMSVNQLAIAAGIARQNLTPALRGERNITLDHLMRMLAVLRPQFGVRGLLRAADLPAPGKQTPGKQQRQRES